MCSSANSRGGIIGVYLATVAFVAASVGLVLVFPLLAEGGLFILFLLQVALITWFGGWRPGILAIGLTSLAGVWLALMPTVSSNVGGPDDRMRFVLYLLASGIILLLHASRERAKVRAWETDQRLAFALKCANMGAWQSDLKTGRFWWSEGMEQLFGRPPGQFSGTYEGFMGYIHPDDQDFVKRAITRTVEGGREFEIEHRIVKPDGQTRWIITRGRISCDEHGVTDRMIGVAIDITASKEREMAVAV